MHLTRLTVSAVRNLEPLELHPDPGLNLVLGGNGAGKTSLLEAIHLLAYGRSFRGRVRDGLVRSGAEALEVFVEWTVAGASGPATRRAGLRHGGQAWEGRLDGEPVDQLGRLCAALEVVTFEPGSHALVEGGGEPRRRFLDWGLFHVEPGFLPVWRRYQRALKQRNALLKSGAGDALLDSWDRELAEAGEPFGRYRRAYLDLLRPWLQPAISRLAPSLGSGELVYQPGWREEELSLADALLVARDRDRAVGHTTVGPHRADWRVVLDIAPNREPLSRGQGKLLALCCLMAQAQAHAGARGSWPVMLLDDLASELDPNHQRRVLAFLQESGAQVFITGTVPPEGLGTLAADRTVMFHVERGEVRPAG